MTLEGDSAPVKAEMSVDAIVLHTKDGPQHCKIRLDKKKHIDKGAVEKHAKEWAAHHRPKKTKGGLPLDRLQRAPVEKGEDDDDDANMPNEPTPQPGAGVFEEVTGSARGCRNY